MFGFIGDIRDVIGNVGKTVGNIAGSVVRSVVDPFGFHEKMKHLIKEASNVPHSMPHRSPGGIDYKKPVIHHSIISHPTFHPAEEIKSLKMERDMLLRKHAALTQRANQLQREMSSLQRQAAVKAQIAMDAAAIPGSGGGIDGDIRGDSGDDGKDKNNMLLYAGIGIAAIAAMYFFMKKK